MPRRPVLIAFAGLPGTGKTTIARPLAARLGAAYIRIDSIETALARSSLAITPAADAGYAVAYALAADNLRAGLDVVTDAVNPLAVTRDAFVAAAEAAGAAVLEVEALCSDPVEHRRRVETRRADIDGHRLPTWDDVARRPVEEWARERLVVDTARVPVGDAVETIAAAVAARR